MVASSANSLKIMGGEYALAYQLVQWFFFAEAVLGLGCYLDVVSSSKEEDEKEERRYHSG